MERREHSPRIGACRIVWPAIGGSIGAGRSRIHSGGVADPRDRRQRLSSDSQRLAATQTRDA